MGKKYTIWTRANGFPDWVDVGCVDTLPDSIQHIEGLKKQDDPMWASAEYRVTPMATGKKAFLKNIQIILTAVK